MKYKLDRHSESMRGTTEVYCTQIGILIIKNETTGDAIRIGARHADWLVGAIKSSVMSANREGGAS